MIRHLLERKHEVVAIAPDGSPEVDRLLADWGVRRLPISLERTGTNFHSDLRVLIQLCRHMKTERPDVVLSYTIKPVVYGAIASRLIGVPHFAAMITGLGFTFNSPTGPRQRIVQGVARILYRIAMTYTNTLFFQNPDDEADFKRAGLLDPKHVIIRIAGSGINLERFPSMKLPDGPIGFLMIARLLADKGVREYLAAAAAARRVRPDLQFHLVGPFDTNPSSVSQEEIAAAVTAGTVVYHGAVTDVRPHLANCHVNVLPSYREGTPRSVLEAMATGRAIITTDAPGCRETIVEGENGLLVVPRDADSLARAFLRIAEFPREEISRMAVASRRIAEERFDVNIVNERIAAALLL